MGQEAIENSSEEKFARVEIRGYEAAVMIGNLRVIGYDSSFGDDPVKLAALHVEQFNTAHESTIKKRVEETMRGTLVRRKDGNDTSPHGVARYWIDSAINLIARANEATIDKAVREAEARVLEEAAKIAEEADFHTREEGRPGEHIAKILRTRKTSSEVG